ncbi:MAG TPA: hypothetical protein VFS20_24745 [Longimicrobium sp.]|nr:hypothetical protein [Longimicrobium sp.]
MLRISAEDWRRDVLYPREQRSGPHTRATADALARRVIKGPAPPCHVSPARTPPKRS